MLRTAERAVPSDSGAASWREGRVFVNWKRRKLCQWRKTLHFDWDLFLGLPKEAHELPGIGHQDESRCPRAGSTAMTRQGEKLAAPMRPGSRFERHGDLLQTGRCGNFSLDSDELSAAIAVVLLLHFTLVSSAAHTSLEFSRIGQPALLILRLRVSQYQSFDC